MFNGQFVRSTYNYPRSLLSGQKDDHRTRSPIEKHATLHSKYMQGKWTASLDQIKEDKNSIPLRERIKAAN